VAEADLDTLQSLVDKSLLRLTNGRFWMLETIRAFALERLEASGEADELSERLVRDCLALAREAQPGLVGRDQKEWVSRIEAERDNIRSALEWSLGSGEPETALQLATALERFWWLRGPAEGLSWLQRGLESAEATVSLRAAALDAAGGAAWFVGDGEMTLRLTEQALSLYRQIGDRAGIAHALTQLAPPLMGLGRVDEAKRVVEEGLAINRELGPRWELVLSTNMLANVACARGDFVRAQELYQESTELARRIGDLWSLVWNLHNQADLALEQEEVSRAESLARESLLVAHEIGDDQAVLICLGILAVAARKAGDASRAGTLWGAAHRLSHDLGDNLWSKGDDYERLQKMLGERTPEFELGVADGDHLSLDEAVVLVAEGA
jgi:tetratricopeptide (TPR) repeat protein